MTTALSCQERQNGRPPARGFIGLVVVILIGALVLAVGLASAFVGQTQMIISGQLDRAQTARQALASCVDEALAQLKKNSAYAGGSVPVGMLTCTVAVSGSGSTRTIAATVTLADVTQAVTVTAGQKLNGAGNAKAWGISAWVEANP